MCPVEHVSGHIHTQRASERDCQLSFAKNFRIILIALGNKLWIWDVENRMCARAIMMRGHQGEKEKRCKKEAVIQQKIYI